MTDRVLLKAISQDRALGSSVLFNHRHTHATPPFHVTVIDLWRSADEFVLIEAFREGAKSTLSEEFLLMEAAYGNFHYCLLIGETYAKACQRLEAIAYEAQRNSKLISLFGKILARKPTEDRVWFASGALIQAIGWEQEIRSFKHRDRRPDRAYLDDIENLERVRDKDVVTQTVVKIYRELLPAMDKVLRKVRWTQTPLAPDCGVTRVRNNPEWVCYRFPIANGNIDDPLTESNWPDRYPMEWIRRERDNYAGAGMLREFMQEYMLEVDTEAAKPFTEEMIVFSDTAPAAWLPRYAIYDPSRTSRQKSAENKRKSDRTGKVVVSRLGSRFLVHESGGYYWKPDEIKTDIFATHEHHHCAGVAVEKNSLDDWLLQPIRFEALRRGVAIHLMAQQAPQDRDKNDFILGLQAFFKSKEIVFIGGRSAHSQLIAEILNFPVGDLDILNALAYILRVFSGDIVYEDFGAENIAPAHEPVAGETVYLAWNASASEVGCVALVRNGRHYAVARDWSGLGALRDVVNTISIEAKATFPRAKLESWVPGELHDSFSRIALVPALREARITPYRAETTAAARGSLAELLRTTIRERRLLTCDHRAKLTINALAGGYRFAVGTGGRRQPEPEQGVSRLVGEALECVVAMLSKGLGEAEPEGANFGVNAQGKRYMTSLPQKTR